jgi:hypothetical protein
LTIEPLVRAPSAAERRRPTRISAALFRAKATAHRARRLVVDFAFGPRRLAKRGEPRLSVVVAESRAPLWSDERAAERDFQLGKVHNLRRALRDLDGVLLPAGAVFSFWKQIGRASRRRGFVVGRMLQQGCLVPAIGGGLCQLSNALYDAALQAGCAIVERHAHSRVVPGSAAAFGRDATVAWNYVDLRFRAAQPIAIEARLSRDELIVRFRGRSERPASVTPASAGVDQPRAAVARSCATCGETGCFRHETGRAGPAGRSAYLVDENWPEFQDYVAARRRPEDVLGMPLDGMRWHLARYRWDTAGYAGTATAPAAALARAAAIRRSAQGPARRQAELRGAQRIAMRLARLLSADVVSLVVAQSLLPFLWREAHLGGRSVCVLMTRPPIAQLQARLDRAAAAHPERRTLADFRAPDWLAEAEVEALVYAERIVTPHAEIARLFPGKAELLEWRLPPVARPAAAPASRRIAFPGPTVARKGAFEMRDAAGALRLELVLLGGELEGAGFWDGVAATRPDPAAGPAGWLDGVAAVVQPALVEERPRHLLMALAAGVPVVATAACGIAPRDGLVLIPEDDPAALIAALQPLLGA